jgi:DNA-binding transcriptional regulator YhcF (GntR family)
MVEIFSDQLVKIMSGILMIIGIMGGVVTAMKYFDKKNNEKIDERIEDQIKEVKTNHYNMDKRLTVVEQLVDFFKEYIRRGNKNG